MESSTPSTSLRAPQRLRSFNRFETKYLVPEALVPRLREEIGARMTRDPYSGPTGYGVWSTYYDTASLRFYWEKIEGIRFRRKLRIRHYGERDDVDDDSPVFVEIKQRVNKVTQKRRVRLPYRQALALCRAEPPDDAGDDRAFNEEVCELVGRLRLRPIAMTGYQREAFLGTDADTGLRVTFDHRVRGRDRDFRFEAEADNRLIVPASRAIVEVKANERIPYWLTDLTARHGLNVVRVSKYCQSVEAHGTAPRSIFHVPVEDTGSHNASADQEPHIPHEDSHMEMSK